MPQSYLLSFVYVLPVGHLDEVCDLRLLVEDRLELGLVLGIDGDLRVRALLGLAGEKLEAVVATVPETLEHAGRVVIEYAGVDDKGSVL